MSKLLIRFWVLDDDTGLKKFGSRWFVYEHDKEDIDNWLSDIPNDSKIVEQTKYIKEN